MSGKILLKLMQGNRILDLNDQARYYLSTDFTPPSASLVPLFSGNSEGYGGADLISESSENRQLAFTVNLVGTSVGQIEQAARNVKQMLRRTTDPTSPLYLVFLPDDTVPEPLWGQFGTMKRYEVVYGQASLSEGYLIGTRRASDINLSVSLILRPVMIGKQQRLCTATGGIIEDNIGMADGSSRGLIVPEVTMNKYTNPIFGHATWNNDWPAGAGLIVSQNTDKNFLLPETINSAKITATDVAGINTIFYQLINVGNTNAHTISLYVKRPDSGAISASICGVYYAALKSTTYTDLGNGIWKLTALVTGVAGNLATGIQMQAGYTIYLLAAQIEEKVYDTPLTYGDRLGCAWTGTAHASTSTRTAAVCKLPIAADTFATGQWSIGMIVLFPFANTYPNLAMLFDASDAGHATGPLAYYQSASDYIAFEYSGAAVATGALTFAAGTKYILHFIFTGEAISLYVNGSLAGSAAAVSANFGANLCLGSTYNSSSYDNSTLMELSIYNIALSATQVANDYANLSQVIADDKRIGALPWLWTKDGDNVVDNCDDSTHDNWCVAGGIPGDLDAETVIDATLNNQLSTPGAVWISKLPMEEFYSPTNFLYGEGSGTAGAGTDSASNYKLTEVLNGLAIICNILNPTNQIAINALLGKEYYAITRLYDEGANLSLATAFVYGAGSTALSTIKAISTTTAFRLFITDPVVMTSLPKQITDGRTSYGVLFYLLGIRSTGTANVRVDFFMVMPRPVVKIYSGSATDARFVYYKRSAQSIYSTNILNGDLGVTGDVIELSPGKYNILISAISEVAWSMTIADTLTYNSIMITPRWLLL